MPRTADTFDTESQNDAVSPILLVAIKDIPLKGDPSTTQSLYLTDQETDVTFSGQLYTACALSYDRVEISKDNEIDQCTLKIDNVNRDFSALAQDYYLNGVWVTMARAFRNTIDSLDGAQALMTGKIKSVLVSEYQLEAIITPDFSLQTRIPRRYYWTKDFPYLPSSKDPSVVFTG